MEPATFFSAIAALRKIVETVNDLKSLNADNEISAVRTDLLAQVGDARQAVLDLQETVATERAKMAELEAENARLRNFDVYRDRYELRSLGEDAVVYALKESSGSGAPPHRVCVACFDRGSRSILQFAGYHGADRILECSVCSARIRCPGANIVSGATFSHHGDPVAGY